MQTQAQQQPQTGTDNQPAVLVARHDREMRIIRAVRVEFTQQAFRVALCQSLRSSSDELSAVDVKELDLLPIPHRHTLTHLRLLRVLRPLDLHALLRPRQLICNIIGEAAAVHTIIFVGKTP